MDEAGQFRQDLPCGHLPALAAVFRVSVNLTVPVKPELLQQALEDTARRIPSFCAGLHKGLFWYYLDTNDHPPRVEPDVQNPCKKIDKRENDGLLFPRAVLPQPYRGGVVPFPSPTAQGDGFSQNPGRPDIYSWRDTR